MVVTLNLPWPVARYPSSRKRSRDRSTAAQLHHEQHAGAVARRIRPPRSVGRVRADVSGYEIDDEPGRVDVEAAWRFLSTEAYWGRWRAREVLADQIAAAWRVVGVYRSAGAAGAAAATDPPGEPGAMVGFARAFSDGAVAYLADVYVLKEHRGH